MIKLTTLTLAICSLVFTKVQSQSTDECMYQAYVSQKTELWKKCVYQATAQTTQKQSDPNYQLNLAIKQYGLLLNTMAGRDEDLFDEYISVTKENLEKVMANPATAAEGKALLSAVMGLQMAYSPMKGITLGGKSGSLAAAAKKLAPDSPITWRFYGSSKLYTPSSFGGNVEEAIEALEKSITLFEIVLATAEHNWLYLDTILLLGQAYAKAGDKMKAIATYEKALRVEPQHSYSKQLLAKAKK